MRYPIFRRPLRRPAASPEHGIGLGYAAERPVEELVRAERLGEQVPARGDNGHALLASEGHGIEVARKRLEIELRAKHAGEFALAVLHGHHQGDDLAPIARARLGRRDHGRAPLSHRVDGPRTHEFRLSVPVAAGGEHASVRRHRHEATHERMSLPHARGQRFQIGILHAVDRAHRGEGEEAFHLAGQDLIKLSGDEGGGVELALVAGTSPVGQVAPESEGGHREERKQGGQHEQREFCSDGQAHERARVSRLPVSIA